MNKYDVIYLDITLFLALCGDVKQIVPYIQEQVAGEIGGVYPEAAGAIAQTKEKNYPEGYGARRCWWASAMMRRRRGMSV